jgi:hypothetical protein
VSRNGLTILLGSFLLFLIQPILGKLLLPVHGGSAGVWTVCLLFFQLLLLAGYAWAHFTRPLWHLGFLLLSLLTLPLGFRQYQPGNPTVAILVSLAMSAGLPYIALAATSPLLQRRLAGDATVYRLYALSNLGSMLALLAYPFAVEPWLPLSSQLSLWTAGYVFFALTWLFNKQQPLTAPAAPAAPGPTLLWIALSACGVALLMASTNQMCQEIAPMPFLWVLPLALYLLSFILCFRYPHFYRRDSMAR